MLIFFISYPVRRIFNAGVLAGKEATETIRAAYAIYRRVLKLVSVAETDR